MSEKVKLSAFLVQGTATLIICSLTTLTGLVYAWPSYTFQIYLSNSTYLDAPITTGQMSILGSITNIGALIATPLCGFAVDRIGRKYSAMLFGIPFVISWGLISATKSFYVVLFAVGFSGFGAAGQAVSTVYISEIVQDSIRGALTSSTVYGFFFGLLSSYTFGGYLSYYNVLYVHLALSVLYILMLIPLKDSPCFLLRCGKDKEAAESIAFYQRVDVKSKEVEIEIQKIKLQLDSTVDKVLEANADTQAEENLLGKTSQVSSSKNETTWQFLKRSPSSQRALVTVLTLMALTILMGSIVLQVYAEPLFLEAIPTMHPNTCSILLAIVYLSAAIVCASTLDKFGRKSLLTVTSILSGIFNIILGTQLHLHWAPHWFTAFVIYGYSFVFNLGAAIVPFVLTGEVFLPQVRGLGNSLSMATMWIMNTVTLVIFNPLVEWCGLGPTFYFFAIICFIGAAYGYFCVPETKGLSAYEIQVLFMKRKSSASPKV